MAMIPGSIALTGMIAPTDSRDTYATHDNQYGKGGFKSVATIGDRDAITTERRAAGMVVYVKTGTEGTPEWYQLNDDLTSWTKMDIGGEVGNPIVDVKYDGGTGNMTFTKALPDNGGEGEPASIVINLPKENFLKSASYNPDTHILTLTLEDGTEVTCDLGELIDTYTFENANGITFTTQNSDGSTKVTAALDDGSIVMGKLATEVQNLINGAIQSTEKGAPNGVPELDENGRIPADQLPAGAITSGLEITSFKINEVATELGLESRYELGTIPTTYNGNWTYTFSNAAQLKANSVKVTAYYNGDSANSELVTAAPLTGPANVSLASLPATATDVRLVLTVEDLDNGLHQFEIATLKSEAVLFYGSSTKDSLINTDVIALSHVVGSTANNVVKCPEGLGYKYVAIPADMFIEGTNLIDASNGMPIVITEQTSSEAPLAVTYNAVETQYRVFRTTYQLNGALSIHVVYPK